MTVTQAHRWAGQIRVVEPVVVSSDRPSNEQLQTRSPAIRFHRPSSGDQKGTLSHPARSADSSRNDPTAPPWAVRLVYPLNCVTFRRAGTLVTCRWSVAVSGRWSDPLVVPVGDAVGGKPVVSAILTVDWPK